MSADNALSLLELFETPMFWMDATMTIRWLNNSTKLSLPHIQNGVSWQDIYEELSRDYVYRLHDYAFNKQTGLLVECILSKELQMQEELQTLRSAYTELENVFHVLDDVFVTDANGITLYINADTERLYGVQKEELLGKSVFELEKERIFYPSVTAMVLRSKQPVTVLQNTKDGHRLIVSGYPVFQEDGSIARVISNANDVTRVQIPFDGKQALRENFPARNNNETTDIKTSSTKMKNLIHLAKRVARTDTSVLLLGETGVGKNHLANFIHRISPRYNGPFVEINCAAIPETLLESELFGYERGAFTGARREGKPGKVELAERGTLFLNEIGELPLSLQSKLLDLLQDRQVVRIGGTRLFKANIRIIAATNQDLAKMVELGTFREDLYYRLSVFPLTLPALRHRTEDIVYIAEQWLERCPSCSFGDSRVLHPDTIQLFEQYHWPGNIRELENVLERMVITVDDTILQPEHVPSYITTAIENNQSLNTLNEQRNLHTIVENSQVERDETASLREQMDVFERFVYRQAIQNSRTTYEIAKQLGVSQPTVVRKLRQFGLSIR